MKTLTAAIAALVVSVTWVVVLQGQASPAPRPLLAEEVFKNVQVLKGIPVDEFMGTMGIIAASVGRGCSECHLLDSGSDWALYAEDTPMKQVARRMMLMVRTINDSSFGGRQEVTCYSCHRGLQRPRVTPSLVALYAAPPDEPDDIITAAGGASAANQIFDKYLTAIGGAAHVDALRSYTATGTYQGWDDQQPSPLQVP